MKKKVILTILFIIIVFSIFYFYKDKTTTTVDLININKLSSKFMDNYFSEVKSLSSQDLDNALIVISKKKIKDGYGATKIIPSPNNQYILVYSNSKDRDNAISILKSDKNVLSVETNKNLYLYNDDNNTNSSNYNSWGIEKMGLDNAISQLNNMDVEDITVAILDSGCDMELFNKYFSGKIVETYNVMDNKSMYDNNGHGTHIAGTIAEGTPNNVKILPVKQTDSPAIPIVNTIAALNWIVYNDKADVVNMSFGIYERIEAVYQTIEAGKQRGIIFVCAAGNDNTGSPSYPAAYDNTISIAAVDSNLEKSFFSNYGKEITFTAPGTAIKSLNRSTTLLAQNNYTFPDDGEEDLETMNGTSMATPHAVCAVAILKSLNKNLSLDDSIELLKKHSIDLGDDGRDIFYGYGFINFSNSNFCDGTNCEEHNVFANNDITNITGISVGNETYESLYNFGNNTNLLNMKMDIEYSGNIHIIKDLGELNNLTINNYDPYVSGEQQVTINYAGFSVNKTVMNHLDDAYEFSDYNTGTIELNSMIPTDNYPKYIEVPEYYHGKKIENISYNVFNNKEDIVKINILSDIKYIEAQGFGGCTNLSELNIPDSVISIGSSAFFQTPSLYTIELPSNLTEIQSNAFSNSGIVSISIPASVQTINTYSFVDANNLTELIIEEGVKKIENKAFSSNLKLHSIVIPSTVTTIETGAFSGDNSINSITINNNPNYESVDNSVTIVEKNTKRLLFANDNSTIPEDVHIIGPYALNSGSFELPSTITTLEDHALYNSLVVILPTSINNIEAPTAFERSSEWNEQNFVHAGSYVHNYLDSNDRKYYILENEDAEVTYTETNYKAFESVDADTVNACINIQGNKDTYNYCTSSFLDKNFKIHYKNNNDSFRYGDDYYIVEVISNITGNSYNKNIEVTVDKAIPTYEVPESLTGNYGDKLSNISLPNGFEWMNGNQTINEYGTLTYKAKFIPEDTNNYETIENIDIIVVVSNNKTVVNPNITVANKVYDGNTNIPSSKISISNLSSSEYSVVSAVANNESVGHRTATIKLRLSDSKFETHTFEGGLQEKEFTVDFDITKADINLTDLSKDVHIVYDGNEHNIDFNLTSESNINIKFMDSNNEYTLNEVPKYTEIGTYVTKYRVYIDNNYNDYYGQKTLIIEDTISYVIDNYDVDETNNYIGKVMINTELDTFTSNITLGVGYAVNVDYKEFDNKKLIYTGGKTKITKNDTLYKEFTNIVIGDINGDGIVDDLDLSKVKKHLMKTDLLKEAYLISSDINYDNKTNSSDLLRMKLHLLGKKPIG